MKKITLFTLALIFIVASLYGCNDNSTETSNNSSENSVNQSITDDSITDVSDIGNDESSIVIDKETPGVPIEGKFGEYTFVDEQDGKSIATIYSWEQLMDIQTRRANGEWFSLSSEDIKFLIEDTRMMFENYDVIKIRDIRGKVNTYNGFSFYFSDEYYECFNGFTTDSNDASCNVKIDLLEAIYSRIEMLNSAAFDSQEGGKIILSDVTTLSENEIAALQNSHAHVFLMGGSSDSDKEVLSKYPVDLYHFVYSDYQLDYISDISKANNAKQTDLCIDLFPEWSGEFKYDIFEKNIVVELWDEETKCMLARIRVDESNNPNEYAELSKRISAIKLDDIDVNPANLGNKVTEQTTDYRVVVYMNGLDFCGGAFSPCFRYSPDGDINLFNIDNPMTIFQHNLLYQQGVEHITEYVNTLLKAKLEN